MSSTPTTFDLFPARNDRALFHDTDSFSLEERVEVMRQLKTRQGHGCWRGPGCTACSRSPIIKAATKWRKDTREYEAQQELLKEGSKHDAAWSVRTHGELTDPGGFKKPPTHDLLKPRLVPPEKDGVSADGNFDVLAVILSEPSHPKSIDWLIFRVREVGWKGAIVVDNAIRCGSGTVTDTQINACRPYLNHTLSMFKPRRFLVVGTPASKAITGGTMHPWNYGSWVSLRPPEGWQMDGRILAVSCPNPAEAWRNTFMRQYLMQAVEQVCFQQHIPARPQVTGVNVTDVETFKAFRSFLEEVLWVSIDYEWSGIAWNNDFQVEALAFSHPTKDVVYVFDRPALCHPKIKGFLTKVLLEKPIVAQNVDAELLATKLHFGVELGVIEGDTMLAAKLLNVEGKAALEDLAYYLGFNRHKDEEAAATKEVASLLKPHLEGRVVGGTGPKAYSMRYIDREVMLRYNALDTYITGLLRDELHQRLAAPKVAFLGDTYREMWLPTTKLLHRIKEQGMRVDKGRLRSARAYLRESVHDQAEALRQMGVTDPNSPEQVRNTLLDHGMYDMLVTHLGNDDMKLAKHRSEKTGQYSTSKYTLKTLGSIITDSDIPNALITYRAEVKLLTAYGETLITYIRDDGRIHPSYRLGGARTGRLSTSGPSVHQIPKHGLNAKLIKGAFVADDGWVLVGFDYKTLEVFIAAILSQDSAMMHACSQLDFHLETAKGMAMSLWGMTPEALEAEVLGIGQPANKAKRSVAKTITFQTMFGGSAYALADAVNISVEEAREALLAYERTYPQFAAWVRLQHETVKRQGFVTIPWVGQPAFLRPLLSAGFSEWGDDRSRVSQSLRQSVNSPIQGCAAQYAVLAGLALSDDFLRDRVPARVEAMIHDSIYVACHQSVVDEVIPRMYHAMTTLPTGCDLRLQVDAEMGESWGAMEAIDLKKHVGAAS